MGNRIAAGILGWGMADGSNEAGGYADFLYANPQRPLVVLMTGVPQGGMLPPGTDPNRWQPLAFDVAFTQNGLEADNWHGTVTSVAELVGLVSGERLAWFSESCGPLPDLGAAARGGGDGGHGESKPQFDEQPRCGINFYHEDRQHR